MSFKTLDILTGIKPDSDKLLIAVSLPRIQLFLSFDNAIISYIHTYVNIFLKKILNIFRFVRSA